MYRRVPSKESQKILAFKIEVNVRVVPVFKNVDPKQNTTGSSGKGQNIKGQ
jgi:hypothetical protein